MDCTKKNINEIKNKELKIFYTPYEVGPDGGLKRCNTCCTLSDGQAKNIRVFVSPDKPAIVEDLDWWESAENRYNRFITGRVIGTGCCTLTIDDPDDPLADPRTHLSIHIFDPTMSFTPTPNKKLKFQYDRRTIPKNNTQYLYPKKYTDFDIYPYKVIRYTFKTENNSVFLLSTSQPWLRTSTERATRIGDNEYEFYILVYPYYLVSGIGSQSFYAGVVTIYDINGNYEPMDEYVYVNTQKSVTIEIDKRKMTVHRIENNIQKIDSVAEGKDFIFQNNRHYINVDKLSEWLGLKVEKNRKEVIIHRYGRFVKLTKDSSTMKVRKFTRPVSIPPNQNAQFEINFQNNAWVIDDQYKNENLYVHSPNYPDSYFVMLRAALSEFGADYIYDPQNPHILKFFIIPDQR